MSRLLRYVICLAVFGDVCLFAQDRIFLKPRPDGNRGYVVELSDKHVVIRFPAEEIEKIERGSVQATSVGLNGEAKSPTAFDSQQPINPPVPLRSGSEPVGEVAGRMVFDGRPLSECKVKLVSLRRKPFVGYIEREDQGQLAIATTDMNGAYRFVGVPAGAYKLKWAVKGDTFWTRKVGTKPDVIVEPGQRNVIPPLEVHKYVIGR